MSNYRFRDVLLPTPFEQAFAYVADPRNLPAWTDAFEEATEEGAVLSTPAGAVRISLEVRASREYGTIDWIMTFPDGSVATALSRIISLGNGTSHYGFVLKAPPGPLEAVEGTLDQQAAILETELERLGEILKAREQN